MIGRSSHSQQKGFKAASFTLVTVALLAVLFMSLLLIKPAMPDRVRLLTGPAGSPYHELGLRYADTLGRRGLGVDVVVTNGGLDNIQRLGDEPDNVVAFAASVINIAASPELRTEHLVSYGSIGFSPLWLFYRSDLHINRVADLAGHRLATAGDGTMSDTVTRKLLELHGIADQVEIASVDQANPDKVSDALTAGRLDAVFVSGSPLSKLIQRLLHTDSVSLLSFSQAAAYAARLSGLTTLDAPEGVFDLARNIPPGDSRLVGATTNLVASDSLHPAVAPLMLGAAADIREESSAFFRDEAFPSDGNLAFPLAKPARRYFQQGETGLSQYLPYNVSRYLNHLGFLVLPILTVVAVLLKLIPTGLKIIGKLRLTSLYRQLEQIDRSNAAGQKQTELLADLDRLDATTATMFVPRTLAPDYVNFRQFLHDLRERVQSR